MFLERLDAVQIRTSTQDHLQIINNRSDYSNRSDCENINDKRYHRWHPGKAFSDEASVKKCICRKHW